MHLLVAKIIKAMYPTDYMDENIVLLKKHKDVLVKFAELSEEEIVRLYDAVVR
tara:strand:+ start:70 stop:228 length:159 start_codon:yes stop_codon:yes gene_type:complete